MSFIREIITKFNSIHFNTSRNHIWNYIKNRIIHFKRKTLRKIIRSIYLFFKNQENDKNSNSLYFYNQKRKRIIIYIIIFISLSLLFIFLFYSFNDKVKIKVKPKALRSKIETHTKDDTTLISNTSSTYIPFGSFSFVKIISSLNTFSKDDKSDHFKNILNLPNIKNRLFSGPNNFMQHDSKSNNLLIPNKFILYDTSFKKNTFYIEGSNININTITEDFNTKNKLTINDKDFFLEGDEAYSKDNLEYIQFKGNAIFKKRELENLNKFKFKINADIFEVFDNLKLIHFTKNVKMKQFESKNNIRSDLSKAKYEWVNSDINIIDLIFIKNVILFIPNQQITISSDFAYYSFEKKIIIFFKDVKIKSLDGISKSDIYIYNTETEEGSYGILDDKEIESFAIKIDKHFKINIYDFIQKNKKTRSLIFNKE